MAKARTVNCEPASPARDFDGTVEFLDENMSRRDLVYVLEHLRFQGRGREALGTLKIDREARTYLISALRRVSGT